MAFCIIVPVGASDYTSQISTLWEQWMHNVNSAYPFLGDLPGLLCSEVCTKSTDGLHHCTSLDNAALANTGHDDKGWYCNCTCAYCGKPSRRIHLILNTPIMTMLPHYPLLVLAVNHPLILVT